MNVNYIWLEMKVELDENNPLLDIKGALNEKNIKVVPYLPLFDSRGYFVEFIADHKSKLFHLMKKIIEERSEKGNGIQIIADTHRFVRDVEVLDCWVKSPSLDLINSPMLNYDLLSTTPSEYIHLYGNRRKLLEDVLRPAFNKVNKDPAKLDWAFHNGPYTITHTSLTMLEGYKWQIALDKSFLVSRNPEVFNELAEELSIVTGREYKKEKVVEELNDIAMKLRKSIKEWAGR